MEALPPTLPLTAAWMLRPNQGWSTLGQVLWEMRISTAKKQVLQSIAGAFPGNAVLHKWHIISSPACTLCGHPAETQSHIQYLCPALKEARTRAHHNIANFEAAVEGYNGCCQRMGHHYGTDCGWSSRPAAASGTDR